MAITVGWNTDQIIDVPLADLTFDRVEPVSGRSIYKMDLNTFRLALKNLEASGTEGIMWPDTHRHNTGLTLGGVTYARSVEILSPYTVRFEDGQYAVEFEGANTNIQDVAVVNQVQIRPANSAGLQIVSTGSGLSAEQDSKLTNINELLEADETFTATLATKYRKGTSTVILQKTVTGGTIAGTITLNE